MSTSMILAHDPADEASAWRDYARSGEGRWLDLDEKRFSPVEERILLGGDGPTRSGVIVSAVTALQVACVFGCVRVIAEDLAKMPFAVMRLDDASNGRQRRVIDRDHPVHEVLAVRPNGWQTPFEFVEYMTFMAALYGEAYAWISRGDDGRVLELLPLLPGAVQADITDRFDVSYIVHGYGASVRLSPDALLRIKGPPADDLRAHDPIHLAREAVGLSMAIQNSTARFNKNDHRPSGILTTSTPIGADQVNLIREQFEKRFGENGDGGIAVLDRMFDYKSLTQNAADSQTIEHRSFQIAEICRYFRVNPQKVMHPSQANGYGSVEQFNINHVNDTLMPWVTRWEQSCDRDLLDAGLAGRGVRKGPGGVGIDRGRYVNVNANALLRGTMTDRIGYYERASKIFMSPNEIRELEEMDPIDDPEFDLPQLQRNNTGGVGSSRTAQSSVKPTGARPSDQGPSNEGPSNDRPSDEEAAS